MKKIQYFLNDTYSKLGSNAFFVGLGPWLTALLAVVIGALFVALSLIILKGLLKINNTATKIILCILVTLLLLIILASYVYLAIKVVGCLGGLVI